MNIDKQHFAKQLGKNIASYRQKLGLTQEQLAEKVDLGNEAVSRIERGVTLPSLLRLFEFAQVFHCNVSDLLDPKVDQNEMAYLAVLIQGLSPTDKKFVLNALQQLVDHLKHKS